MSTAEAEIRENARAIGPLVDALLKAMEGTDTAARIEATKAVNVKLEEMISKPLG